MNDQVPQAPGLIAWVAGHRRQTGTILLTLGIILIALDVVLGARTGTEYLMILVLGGLLAALTLVAGVAARFRPEGAGSPIDEARFLVLTLGGLAGLIVALIGLTLTYRWWESLTNWLRLGEREGAWQVLVAFIVLIAGLALMFAALQSARSEERQSAVIRRLIYGYNTVLTGILVFLILVVVNVLAYAKLPSVLDSTESGAATLGDRSVQILKALDKPTTVYLLMPTDDRIYEDLRTLLSRAQDYAPRLKVETLSTGLNAARIRELVKQFPQVGSISSEGVLIVYGEDKPEASFIKADDLIKSDFSPEGGRSIAFQGESRVMTELSFLAENKQKPVVYFTTGNAGEMDFNNSDMNRDDALGVLQRRLIQRNFDARPLKFDPADPKVPDDATVVVIPGPRSGFSDRVVDALRKYLDERKGKLIALVGVPPVGRNVDTMPATGLEALLAAYKVELTKERVLSVPSLLGQYIIQDPEITLVEVADEVLRAQNPIAAAFRNTRLGFVQSRVVRAAPSGSPAIRSETLLQTAEGLPVWAESSLQASGRQVAQLMRRDPKEAAARIHGSLPLAVAVSESSSPAMPGAPPSPAKPRMVVVGDSVWVSNPYVDEARATEPNFDLFVSLLDWLRERPSNIGIEPRPYKNYLLDRSASFVRLALLPALVALVGIIGLGAGVWVVRRR